MHIINEWINIYFLPVYIAGAIFYFLTHTCIILLSCEFAEHYHFLRTSAGSSIIITSYQH